MTLLIVLSKVSQIILAIGVLLAWWQVRELRKTSSDDHDRSRREKAIDLVCLWTSSLHQKSSIARKLVETMSDEQARQLQNQESIVFRRAQSKLLKGYLDEGHSAQNQDGEITLNEADASTLRWVTITYLNNLEAILAAWHHQVADRDIILEEFRYLVSDADGHDILDKFRRAAGGVDVFPAIAKFASAVNEKRQAASTGKSALPSK